MVSFCLTSCPSPSWTVCVCVFSVRTASEAACPGTACSCSTTGTWAATSSTMPCWREPGSSWRASCSSGAPAWSPLSKVGSSLSAPRVRLSPVHLCFTVCFPPTEGATEAQLNIIEAQIGCRLPDDYRCSYRIHNGQKLVIPGSVPVWLSPPVSASATLTHLSWYVCESSGWWAACLYPTTTAPRCCWMWRRPLGASSRGRGCSAACRSPSASTPDSASTWRWSLLRDAACMRVSTRVLWVTFQNKRQRAEGNLEKRQQGDFSQGRIKWWWWYRKFNFLNCLVLISYFNLLKRIKSPVLHLNFLLLSHFGVNLAKTLFCALCIYFCLIPLDE